MATDDRASENPPQPEASNDAAPPSSTDHIDHAAATTTSSSFSAAAADANTNPAQDEQQEQPNPDATASPPRAPPNRNTPTAPGPRAQRFEQMFNLALTHTLAKISPDNFSSCYPTIAAQAPHILKQVQKAMVDRLAHLCHQEFAAVLARYQVVAKLNELETLVADAEQRRRQQRDPWLPPTTTLSSTSTSTSKKAGKQKETDASLDGAAGDERLPESTKPPHLLPAGAVLAAHLAPHLAGQQSQMNARLQNTQAANATLWEAIQAQRREVDELLGALEAALKDIDGAAALMDGVPADDLATESQTVEAEMADV